MRSASPHPQRRRSRPAAATVEPRATSGGACRHTRRGGTRSDLPQARRCCSHSCARAAHPPHETRPRSQVDGPLGSPTPPRCWSGRMRRASRGRRAIRRLPPAARGEACRLSELPLPCRLARRVGDERDACSAWESDKTDTVSDFLGETVGQKTQKQGEVHLPDVCKIRFLMAGTQRSVSAPHHARHQQPAPRREPAP